MDDTGAYTLRFTCLYTNNAHNTGFFSVQVLENALRVFGLKFAISVHSRSGCPAESVSLGLCDGEAQI